MRIVTVCRSTRGGVQPYTALAQGLQRACQAVAAVAPANLKALFTEVGVEAAPLSNGDDAVQMAQSGVAEMRGAARRALTKRELPRQIGGWVCGQAAAIDVRDRCAPATIEGAARPRDGRFKAGQAL